MEFLRGWLEDADRARQLFAERFGVHDLSRALHKEEIPIHGALDDAGTITYRAHKEGVEVHFGDVPVDLAFGPEGRTDGFDVFRLSRYVRAQRARFPELKKDLDVTRAFRDMKSLGLVVCPRWTPGPQLLYLAETVQDAEHAVAV